MAAGKLTRGRLECPECGSKLDGFTPAKSGTIPQSGDLGVCASCAAVLEFLPDALGYRVPGAGHLAALPPEARALLEMARRVVRGLRWGG
jgi:hypothetical protein